MEMEQSSMHLYHKRSFFVKTEVIKFNKAHAVVTHMNMNSRSFGGNFVFNGNLFFELRDNRTVSFTFALKDLIRVKHSFIH